MARPGPSTWIRISPGATNPVTADDVVFTFQYQADPNHAWDFAWFWSDIVNWDEAVAGDSTDLAKSV